MQVSPLPKGCRKYRKGLIPNKDYINKQNKNQQDKDRTNREVISGKERPTEIKIIVGNYGDKQDHPEQANENRAKCDGIMSAFPITKRR